MFTLLGVKIVTEEKVAVLIPYWVKEVLRRNNLPLSTCLEFDKIRPLLSMNDLTTFLTLQNSKYFKSVTNVDITGQLSYIWGKGLIKSNSELYDVLWKSLIPMQNDISFINELNERLFGNSIKEAKFPESYAMYDITPEVFGIVIYPGHFNNSNVNLQKLVLESIIEVLYRYYSFHEVAKTQFFKGYLELLSIS